MAVAIGSPFVLSNPTIDIPQEGLHIARGRRRRINNDPYGGEGYIWDEMIVTPDGEQKVHAQGTETPDEEQQIFSQTTPDHIPEQAQSAAVLRLDLLRQHLIDLRSTKRSCQGFNLDNIHLGIRELQDWQAPRRSFPQHLNSFVPPNPQFNEQWQRFVRGVIFPSHMPHLLTARKVETARDFCNTAVLQPQRLGPQEDNGLQTGLSACSHRSRPWRDPLGFEPVDIHCSSWSSLVAQRRRKVAAIA